MNKCFKSKVCDSDRWPLGCPDSILDYIESKADDILDLAEGEYGLEMYRFDPRQYANIAMDIKYRVMHLHERCMRYCLNEKPLCETLSNDRGCCRYEDHRIKTGYD